MLCIDKPRTIRVVHIVCGSNRVRFRKQIEEMHRDRKRLFVDRYKWNVKVVDDDYEIDEFDGEYATYLIETDNAGSHLASVRLLPTTRPHLLSTAFSALCEGTIPTGEDVMELTRLCVTPDLPKPDAVRLCNLMWVASVEFALLFGISKYTGVSQAQFLSSLLSSGWEIVPLSLPREIDGQLTGALVITITPETLRRARARSGYRYPVLEVLPESLAA